MSEKILVPALGESITEATVSKWLKKVGDPVETDEAIVELETDKVNLEVPSPISGVLSEMNSKDGDTVEVGAVLGSISEGKLNVEKKAPLKQEKEVETIDEDKIMDKLQQLEAKILSADNSGMINEHRSLIESDVATKLRDVEDLVLPLLFNLQKNPEKEYIHWPNRTAIIDKQIEKIKAVTRYYERI